MMLKRGVTIFLNEDDKFDLSEILGVIGDAGRSSFWKLDNVECFGAAAGTLHLFADADDIIDDENFKRSCAGIVQTIAGTFEAFRAGQTNAWLTIRAIRGTEFDIETEDTEILYNIRNSFRNVRDLIY